MLSLLVIAFFLLLFSHLALRDRVAILEQKNELSNDGLLTKASTAEQIEPPQISLRSIPNFPPTGSSFTTITSSDEQLSQQNKTALAGWFKEDTPWLSILGALVVLSAPLFTDISVYPVSVIFYLLILTVGFLILGAKLEYRILTLIFSVGILAHGMNLVKFIPPNTLWIFMAVASCLFLTSVTASLVKSAKVKVIDTVTLTIISLGYVGFASLLSSNPSSSVFCASVLFGLISYFLFKKNFATYIVGLYAAFSTIGLLIGTCFLLLGPTLILAIICELTVAFLILTYLSLPERFIWISAILFIFPLLGSFVSLESSAWEYGIWHSDALVVYTMLMSFCLCTFWLIHKPGVAIFSSGKILAGYLGLLSVVYAYVVSAKVMDSVFNKSDSLVMTYVLWAIISMAVVYYAYQQELPRRVTNYAALSLLLPVLVSLKSFSSPVWVDGIYHNQSFGLLAIIVIGLLVILLFVQQFCHDFDVSLRKIIGWLVIFETTYIFAAVSVFAHSLLAPNSALVAIYVIYTTLLYLMISLLVRLQAQISWIKLTLLALFLPIFLSLDSFALQGWAKEEFLINLIGLLSLVIIFFLLSFGLRNHALYTNKKSGLPVFNLWSRGLLFLPVLYLIGTSWSLAQTFLPKMEAIILALFVYIILGAALFIYKKRKRNKVILDLLNI